MKRSNVVLTCNAFQNECKLPVKDLNSWEKERHSAKIKGVNFFFIASDKGIPETC